MILQPWQMQHAKAMRAPTADEALIVGLVNACTDTAHLFATDNLLRLGVSDIIKGTRVLLLAPWGLRLDMGSLDAVLSEAYVLVRPK